MPDQLARQGRERLVKAPKHVQKLNFASLIKAAALHAHATKGTSLAWSPRARACVCLPAFLICQLHVLSFAAHLNAIHSAVSLPLFCTRASLFPPAVAAPHGQLHRSLRAQAHGCFCIQSLGQFSLMPFLPLHNESRGILPRASSS